MNECSHTSIYMAAYCHKELTVGLKGLSDQETNDRLDALVRLF